MAITFSDSLKRRFEEIALSEQAKHPVACVSTNSVLIHSSDGRDCRIFLLEPVAVLNGQDVHIKLSGSASGVQTIDFFATRAGTLVGWNLDSHTPLWEDDLHGNPKPPVTLKTVDLSAPEPATQGDRPLTGLDDAW